MAVSSSTTRWSCPGLAWTTPGWRRRPPTRGLGGVCLHHLVHMSRGLVGPLSALDLFGASLVYLGHQSGHLLRKAFLLVEALGGLIPASLAPWLMRAPRPPRWAARGRWRPQPRAGPGCIPFRQLRRSPTPASPARAAFTAAFKASRLVWKSITSMERTILPVCLPASAIWPRPGPRAVALRALSAVWPGSWRPSSSR
jgi:hypothetical protein